jgi:hypothetical protein
MALPPVTKFFRREILADQQSVAELWKIRDTNLNTIPILTMRALLLNSSVILVIKGLGGKFCGLEFLANFILK